MCFRCREDAAITSMGGVPLFGGVERLSLNKLDGRGRGRCDFGACECTKCLGRECAAGCPTCTALPVLQETIRKGVAAEERAALENTPAVDHETFLRCAFCEKRIGVRIVVTKCGAGWVQVAAGAWVSFGEPVDQLQVRCAQCLLPEV